MSIRGVPHARQFFIGLSPLVTEAIVKTVVRFSAFDWACDVLRDPEQNPGSPLRGARLLTAGAIAGFAESICIVPFENIKTCMIEGYLVSLGAKLPRNEMRRSADTPLSRRPTIHRVQKEYKITNLPATGIIKDIYKQRGFRGFWQGTMPTLLRQVGNSTVRFTSFTAFRQMVPAHLRENEYVASGLGIVSSGAIVVLTQPLDVIKTRQQSQIGKLQYKNSINCAYRIFIQEGVRTFWAGSAPRFFKVALSGSITFGVYQYIQNWATVLKHNDYI